MSAHLLKADQLRDARLSQYASGVRLAGYEELQTHLQAVAVAFGEHRILRDLAFLVVRAQGDFQTCLEATLSGYPAVAQDSMRDVMEIEFLLREFYFEPAHIADWLQCSDKERNDRFRPAVLRQRHAARVGKRLQDMGEGADYRGHSMFLHVSPHANPFGGPGLVADRSPFSADSCFWELFEHARRVVHAFHVLRRKLAPRLRAKSPAPRSLKKLRLAWQQTQTMQTIWLAMIKVIRDEQSASLPNSQLQPIAPSEDAPAG